MDFCNTFTVTFSSASVGTAEIAASNAICGTRVNEISANFMFYQLRRLRVTVTPFALTNTGTPVHWLVGYQGGAIGTTTAYSTAEMKDQVCGVSSNVSASTGGCSSTNHNQDFSVPRSRCFAGPQWLRTESSAADPQEISTCGFVQFQTSATCNGSWTVTLRFKMAFKVPVDSAVNPELIITNLDREYRKSGLLRMMVTSSETSFLQDDIVVESYPVSQCRDDKSKQAESDRLKDLISKLKRLRDRVEDT
jgi:hypothetical protein